MKIGLRKAYLLLELLGHPEGAAYSQREEEMKVVTGFRNASILAHGLEPLDVKKYERFEEAVLQILDVNPKDLPAFPSMALG